MGTVQICYELSAPEIHQLTPQEITTLLGTNNVWANTGNVNVTYGAYLEGVKEHADILVHKLMAQIAPVETGTSASQEYAQGKYFFLNGKFCKAKTSISSGATFTLGTNYEETAIAAELYAALNS